MTLWINDFIKINRYSRPGLKLNGKKKGILHYTANLGATAKNHVTYFGKSLIELNERLPEDDRRFASAHIFVDKNEARCIIPLDEVAYAANEGSYRGVSALKPNANFLSINVEMCQEKDGSFHPDTIKRTEDVFVELSRMFKWDPMDDIVRHYDVTHKNCPAPWVKDSQKFIDFKRRVKVKLDGGGSISKPNPPKVAPAKQSGNLGLVDWMKSKKMDSSYSNRSKLAKEYGISGYSGTAVQNTSLLAKLQAGKPVAPPKKESKPKTKKVYLPAADSSWRVYPTNKAPVAGNEKGFLNPKKFGGLSYEIIGNPQKDVYTIKTDDFGKVNIYAAPSTGAVIK